MGTAVALWWMIAGAIGGFAVAMMTWAVLGDRVQRGPRVSRAPRCPSCGYDRSGTEGLTCAECGRTARHRDDLVRLRIGWMKIMVALVLLVVAAGVAFVPRVRDHGPPSWTPTTVLILMTPWEAELCPGPMGKGESPVLGLLHQRRQGGMYRWQRRWLAARLPGRIRRTGATNVEAVGDLLVRLGPDAAPAARRLGAIIANRAMDPGRADALILLRQILPHATGAIPDLITAAWDSTTSRQNQLGAIDLLATLPEHAALLGARAASEDAPSPPDLTWTIANLPWAARSRLPLVMSVDPVETRAWALPISTVGPRGSESLEPIQRSPWSGANAGVSWRGTAGDATSPDNVETRYRFAWDAMVNAADSAAARVVVKRTLVDADPAIRHLGVVLCGVYDRCWRTREEVDWWTSQLATLADDPDGHVRRIAAVALFILSGDPEARRDALVRLLSEDDPRVRATAAHAIGLDAALVRQLVSPLAGTLVDPDLRVRYAGTIALAQLVHVGEMNRLDGVDLLPTLTECVSMDAPVVIRGMAAVTLQMLSRDGNVDARAALQAMLAEMAAEAAAGQPSP